MLSSEFHQKLEAPGEEVVSLETIYYIGQTTAVVMIFASLIFVGIQVRQANKATQLAALDSIRQERRQVFLTGRDSPYIPGIMDKLYNDQSLSGEEAHRWIFHLSVMWGLAYSEWLQTETRVMTGYESKGAIDVVLRLPHSLEWFDISGRRVYPSAFCNYIDQRKRDVVASYALKPLHDRIKSPKTGRTQEA